MSEDKMMQVVTFGLGNEKFAVSVSLVREILDYRDPFHIPNAPAWLLGLTDVRGQGVPTIDFRARLGLTPAEPGSATRLLVLDVMTDKRTLPLALVVDRVFDVTAFGVGEIEAAPDIGVRWPSDYIEGVVRRDDGFVVLVDVARIFSEADQDLLPAVAAAA